MNATTYYPGDIVRTRTGKCDAVIELVTPASTAAEIERFAAIRAASPTGSGPLPVEKPFVQYRTLRDGQPFGATRFTHALDGLRLVERGEQGKAADADAQRKADEIAEQARIERRADPRPALNSSRRPAKFGLSAPRPAFQDTATTGQDSGQDPFAERCGKHPNTSTTDPDREVHEMPSTPIPFHPPTGHKIADPGELDALPVHAVVRIGYAIFQHIGDGRYISPGVRDRWASVNLWVKSQMQKAPVVVVWVPDAEQP